VHNGSSDADDVPMLTSQELSAGAPLTATEVAARDENQYE
jgi:hypothetical protein